MIDVIPYQETAGSVGFKTFLGNTFTIDMLYPIFGDESCTTLFDDWRGKDMVNWFRFTNEDKVILEFYPTHYIVKKTGSDAINCTLSIPKTIDMFINDMFRFNIKLYWGGWVDEEFEPKEYLHRDKIKIYFTDLLNRMGKSHELL